MKHVYYEQQLNFIVTVNFISPSLLLTRKFSKKVFYCNHIGCNKKQSSMFC